MATGIRTETDRTDNRQEWETRTVTVTGPGCAAQTVMATETRAADRRDPMAIRNQGGRPHRPYGDRNQSERSTDHMATGTRVETDRMATVRMETETLRQPDQGRQSAGRRPQFRRQSPGRWFRSAGNRQGRPGTACQGRSGGRGGNNDDRAALDRDRHWIMQTQSAPTAK